jgi:hypothetical protein
MGRSSQIRRRSEGHAPRAYSQFAEVLTGRVNQNAPARELAA